MGKLTNKGDGMNSYMGLCACCPEYFCNRSTGEGDSIQNVRQKDRLQKWVAVPLQIISLKLRERVLISIYSDLS